MPNNAVVVNESAAVYEDVLMTNPLGVDLPIGSEFEMGKAFASSVAVTLPDGRQGYISGNTQVRCFQHILLKQESAPAYQGPSAESALLGQYYKGDELWIANLVKDGSGTWIEVRDSAGNPSYISGKANVLVVDELNKSIAKAFGSGRRADLIVQDLVKSDVPPAVANRLTAQMQQAIAEVQHNPGFRRELANKYARHMIYGILWAAGGTIITVATYSAAASSPSGGRYVVFYGAIVWGIIDFFRGLAGWIRYSAKA